MSDFGLDVADNELLKSSDSIRNTEPMKIYFQKLEEFVPNLNSIDVAFVDQGFHFRGESVNYFLEKQISIVIAHDTSDGHNKIYGYDKIVVPENYKKNTSTEGMGITIFRK